MDVQIQALELHQPSSNSTTINMPGPSIDVVTAFPSNSATDFNITPHRSLTTAINAPSTGPSFFPPAFAISPHMQAQILAGNDINLVKILYIQRFNQRIDWSVINLALISRHFTGH